MEEKLLQQLYKLRSIKPEANFAKRSRSLILVPKRQKLFIFPQFAWAGAFVAVLLVFTFGILPQYLKGPTLSSLNASNLSQEFKNLSINIELKELSYQQTVNQAIASALAEIGDNQTSHLSPSLLEAENNEINLEEISNPEINKLLDQVIF